MKRLVLPLLALALAAPLNSTADDYGVLSRTVEISPDTETERKPQSEDPATPSPAEESHAEGAEGAANATLLSPDMAAEIQRLDASLLPEIEAILAQRKALGEDEAVETASHDLYELVSVLFSWQTEELADEFKRLSDPSLEPGSNELRALLKRFDEVMSRTNTPAARLSAALVKRHEAAGPVSDLDALVIAIGTLPDPLPDARRILDRGGIDLNRYASRARTSTPLHEAVRRGRPETVRLLVERGADVNFPGSLCEGRSSYPIETAARAGHLEIARFLLDSGAEVDKSSDNAMNATVEAARFLHPDLLALLFERGGTIATNALPPWCSEDAPGNPSFCDARWPEPLTPDEKERHLACLRLLVEHGLPLDRPAGRYERRHTPLTWCVLRDCPDDVAYLLSAGADPGVFLPQWTAADDPRGAAFAIARQFARTNCLAVLERHTP